MDAEVKIADLEEEADRLGRYIGKRKAVEGSGRRVVQGGWKEEQEIIISTSYLLHRSQPKPNSSVLNTLSYLLSILKIKHSSYSWLYLCEHSGDAMQVIKNDGTEKVQ